MKNKSLDKTTCFEAHKSQNKNCQNKKCRYWHELDSDNNCIINKSSNKTHTLQEIGDLFNITRMRICQIEKQTLQKIKKKTLKSI